MSVRENLSVEPRSIFGPGVTDAGKELGANGSERRTTNTALVNVAEIERQNFESVEGARSRKPPYSIARQRSTSYRAAPGY